MSDHDLPNHGILQNMNARPVSGEHLEVLGKRAAALFSDGREKNLSDAVVSVVKTAGLSPEQVKRVVEFANTSAYLSDFNKEGSPHRVVDFGPGGLADPAVVLQDLNDGGGGSRFDSGSFDYHSPPEQSKTASAFEDVAFQQMFATSGAEYPEVNPLGEAIDLRDKLASAYETTTSMLSSLEVMYDDLRGRLFDNVKQASLHGHSLAEIVKIWEGVAPSHEHVKVAFQAVMDPLVDNGVFRNHEEVADSLSKHASARIPDLTHPLVVDFQDFCEVSTKLAHAREAQQELGEGVARLTSFLKESSEGLIGYGKRLLRGAGNLGESVGDVIAGEGGKEVGRRAGKVVLLSAGALGANEMLNRPTSRKVVRGLAAVTPGTDEYNARQEYFDAKSRGYV